jgi:hypothetical protein
MTLAEYLSVQKVCGGDICDPRLMCFYVGKDEDNEDNL